MTEGLLNSFVDLVIEDAALFQKICALQYVYLADQGEQEAIVDAKVIQSEQIEPIDHLMSQIREAVKAFEFGDIGSYKMGVFVLCMGIENYKAFVKDHIQQTDGVDIKPDEEITHLLSICEPLESPIVQTAWTQLCAIADPYPHQARIVEMAQTGLSLFANVAFLFDKENESDRFRACIRLYWFLGELDHLKACIGQLPPGKDKIEIIKAILGEITENEIKADPEFLTWLIMGAGQFDHLEAEENAFDLDELRDYQQYLWAILDSDRDIAIGIAFVLGQNKNTDRLLSAVIVYLQAQFQVDYNPADAETIRNALNDQVKNTSNFSVTFHSPSVPRVEDRLAYIALDSLDPRRKALKFLEQLEEAYDTDDVFLEQCLPIFVELIKLMTKASYYYPGVSSFLLELIKSSALEECFDDCIGFLLAFYHEFDRDQEVSELFFQIGNNYRIKKTPLDETRETSKPGSGQVELVPTPIALTEDVAVKVLAAHVLSSRFSGRNPSESEFNPEAEFTKVLCAYYKFYDGGDTGMPFRKVDDFLKAYTVTDADNKVMGFKALMKRVVDQLYTYADSLAALKAKNTCHKALDDALKLGKDGEIPAEVSVQSMFGDMTMVLAPPKLRVPKMEEVVRQMPQQKLKPVVS